MLKYCLSLLIAIVCCQTQLHAHCQMPCGVYHDDMVYDQIDQYAETMFKAVNVLTHSKFQTVEEKNEFMRWIYQKEVQSNAAAELICTYFLMQKIKPGETDTVKRLVSAHKLLFLIVGIKQNVDNSFVQDFLEEWERFKLMFHIEGYECKVEMLKMKKREAKEAELKNGGAPKADDHDHTHEEGEDHDHPHPH